MIRQVLTIVLLVVSQSIGTFNVIKFDNKTDAVCIDGTPGGIYHFQPEIKGPNKLLVIFEDTPEGWCYKGDVSHSISQCYEWKDKDYGSSKGYDGQIIYWSGIASQTAPGEFAQWAKVIIKSCDGGSYVGNSNVEVRKEKMYFRGSRIVEEAIQLMKQIKIIQNREEVVVAGIYNGAAPAMMWAEKIQEATTGKVKILVDGGHFLNVESRKKKEINIQTRLQNLEKIALSDGSFPFKPCQEKFKGELWKCFIVENLAPLIKFPIFYAQSFYDPVHLSQIVGYDCTNALHSLSECSQAEREGIQDYSHKVQTSLRELVGLNEENGAWGLSCVEHDILSMKYGDSRYAVPMGKDTAAIAIQKWVKGEKVQLFDEKDWPGNVNCAHKLLPILTTEEK